MTSLPHTRSSDFIPAELIAKSQSLCSDPFRKTAIRRAPLLSSLAL